MAEHGLGELPSKVFYNSLNNSKKDNTYSIDCANVGKDTSEKEKINDICSKLGQNINYLENNHNRNPLFFDKHCYDLNYWLYHKVNEEFGKGDTKKNINLFFEEIQNQWNNIDRNGKPDNSGKICKPELQIFKTGLFKSIKELLDYFENFDTFKNEIGTSNQKPNKYCDTIKKCVPLYFTFQQLCKLIKNDICNKYIHKDDRYNPKELLSNLSCVEGGTYEVKLDERLVAEMIKTYQSGFGDLLSGFGNFLPGVGSLIPGLGHLFTGSLPGMFMNSIYDLVQKGFDGSGITTLYNKITSYTDIFYSENFQKYGLPSLFGLGCLIILFIFYKCCGCLPCCCISKRRKKKRKRLSDLDTSGLMSAPLGFPAPMMPMNPYGLRYQPM
ncbi:Plasmodium vivax Vir protein, putative [Plasmodium vivax]|nr:Plasmodium vivax Vir protein, putative [Plasmodium vivax]